MNAGSRLSGSLGLGASYDDAAALEANSPSSAASQERLMLGWRARTASNLALRADLAYTGSESFSDPAAGSRDAFLGLGADWRLIDSLSFVAKAEGEASQFPAASATDFNRGRAGLGLAWTPAASSLISAGLLYEKVSTPSYDLDNQSGGGEAAFEQELPLGLKFNASYTRLSTGYSRRAVLAYPPYLIQVNPALRHDESSSGQASLGFEGADESVSVGWRDESLRSNGNAIDFGPFQDIYNDTNFSDNSLVQNYYGMRRSGPTLAASWQGLGWLKLSAKGWLESAAWESRPAKDAADKFVPGMPGRHDEVWDARYALNFYFSFLGLDWDAELAEIAQNSASNDFQSNFSRHFTQLLLNLEF